MARTKTLKSVLHIGKFYPPHNGGIETHLRDLASRQRAKIAVNAVVANDHAYTSHEIMEGVEVTRCATFGSIASMPICPSMARHLALPAADIIHLHTPNPGAALALLLSRRRECVVITHHADTLGRPLLRRLSDPVVRMVMDRASVIIVTSLRYLASSQELAPYKQKCRVVPLAIDPTSYSEDIGQSQEIRGRFGERMLLSVGRLVPYKGLRFAIEAMTHVDGHLCIIGHGPEENFLRRFARESGISDRVTFLGRTNDLRPYYQAARALVLPSVTRAEAFGVVQLEAMASGTPVINTDLDSGVPEVGVDGVNALTVPPGDPMALARAMQTMLDDTCVHDRLAVGARRIIHERYLLDKMVDSTLAIYRDILNMSDDLT